MGAKLRGFFRLFLILVLFMANCYSGEDFGTNSQGSPSDGYGLTTDDARLLPKTVLRYGTDAEVRLSCAAYFRGYPLIWSRENATRLDRNNPDVADGTFWVDPSDGFALVIRNKDRKRYPLTTGNYSCQLDKEGLHNLTTATTDEKYLKNVSDVILVVTYAATPDVRLERIHAKNNSLVLACTYSGHSAIPPLGFYFHFRNPITDTREDRTIFTDDPAGKVRGMDLLSDCSPPNGKKCSGRYVISRNVTLDKLFGKGENPQFEQALILEVPTVNKTDAGHYGCWAGNDAGTGYAQLKVNINDCTDGTTCITTEPASPYY
ncbi:hypothetical protein BV898_02691 [Hypsibius exemplaris]|uniref:Ig-like domain-containing protein n=1 Tax=Hypsibius exemplaris TaxID=2072580 RepID=A0A1W0X7U7_HYPEX|nr:hypothetical protein BV898_02691 [Hypsibius exemplaris]